MMTRARSSALFLAVLMCLMSCSMAWAAAPSKQKLFETPDEAVQSLIEVIRQGDTKAMVDVLGPTSGPLVSSGDAVEDQRAREAFLRAYVDAQREYYARERKQGEVHEYAQRLGSTAGKRDGLYWDAKPGEEASPFGRSEERRVG